MSSRTDGWRADTPELLEQQYRTLASALIYMRRRSKDAAYNDFTRGYWEAESDLSHILGEIGYALYRMDPERSKAVRLEFKDEDGNWK